MEHNSPRGDTRLLEKNSFPHTRITRASSEIQDVSSWRYMQNMVQEVPIAQVSRTPIIHNMRKKDATKPPKQLNGYSHKGRGIKMRQKKTNHAKFPLNHLFAAGRVWFGTITGNTRRSATASIRRWRRRRRDFEITRIKSRLE